MNTNYPNMKAINLITICGGFFAEKSRATSLSISEMKEFVQKNLKEIQTQSKAISMHIGAAEVIQVKLWLISLK